MTTYMLNRYNTISKIQLPDDVINQIYMYEHPALSKEIINKIFSFTLNPKEHQPSGTMNFSRLDSHNIIWN